MSEPSPKPKSFPWRCPECQQNAVYPDAISYTAKVKHDGRIHEFVIPQLRVPKCRSCGELLFDSEVDSQISAGLRGHLKLLQPDEIRHCREALRQTQKKLAERTGIAEETISRWESGSRIQSRAMDNLLRLYFGVPEARQVLGEPAATKGVEPAQTTGRWKP